MQMFAIQPQTSNFQPLNDGCKMVFSNISFVYSIIWYYYEAINLNVDYYNIYICPKSTAHLAFQWVSQRFVLVSYIARTHIDLMRFFSKSIIIIWFGHAINYNLYNYIWAKSMLRLNFGSPLSISQFIQHTMSMCTMKMNRFERNSNIRIKLTINRY